MPDSRQYVLWAFKMTGCVDCGYRPESIDDLKKMDCDHRDPASKASFSSSSLHALNNPRIGSRGRGFGELFDELWKCDPVCKPCHYKRGRDRADRARDMRGQIPLPLREWIKETTDGW